MIITRLTGGLGNQMFQYAAGLALAEQRRTVLKLDVSWYREYAEFEAHNRYALSCLNITEQFATEEEIGRIRGVALTRVEQWSRRLAKKLHFYRYASMHSHPPGLHYAESFGFYPRFFELPDNTYLHGMWQSEGFFSPVANLLRLHFSFRYPPQPAVEAMSDIIRSHRPAIALHFRRGDYARNASFSQEMGVIGWDYYRQATARMLELYPSATFFIFSDDVEAIEREYALPGPKIFVKAAHHWHSYDKIRLMSECDHAVISNSTFAWWGAWLNPCPTKTIIAPDPWFSGNQGQGADLVPPSWVRLDPKRAE